MTRTIVTMALLPLAAGVAVALALHPGGRPGANAAHREAPGQPPAPSAGAAVGPESAPPPAAPTRPSGPPSSRGPSNPSPGGRAEGVVDPLNPATAPEPDAYLRTVRAIVEAKPILALRYTRQMKAIYPDLDRAYEVEPRREEVEALTNLGRVSEARERAAAFMEEFPAEGAHSYRVHFLLNVVLDQP